MGFTLKALKCSALETVFSNNRLIRSEYCELVRWVRVVALKVILEVTAPLRPSSASQECSIGPRPNVHPADELSALREEISQLYWLRDQLLAPGASLKGDTCTAVIVPSKRETLDRKGDHRGLRRGSRGQTTHYKTVKLSMKKERILFEPRAPMWRIRDAIHYLGGVGKVSEKLIAKGYRPPPANTMQGWATRNQIPSPWQLAIIGLAMDEGLIAHPDELLLKETQ